MLDDRVFYCSIACSTKSLCYSESGWKFIEYPFCGMLHIFKEILSCAIDFYMSLEKRVEKHIITWGEIEISDHYRDSY